MGDAVDNLTDLNEKLQMEHDLGICDTESPCPLCEEENQTMTNEQAHANFRAAMKKITSCESVIPGDVVDIA